MHKNKDVKIEEKENIIYIMVTFSPKLTYDYLLIFIFRWKL